MAKLYVTEFVGAGRYYGSAIPVAHTGSWTENAASPMSIGASAVFSSTFSVNSSLIRLHADSICSILVGKSTANGGGTVTANNARMTANQTEYYEVVPGQVISVITNS